MNGEKNSKSESKEELPKFNQDQYNRLIECSKKGPEGIREWNKWREENPDEEIWLQGADLNNANLQGAILLHANLEGADLESANLQEADLWDAELQGADLESANLQGAHLAGANLQGADLYRANLQGAKLRDVNLQGAKLDEANLQEADLDNANLEGVYLQYAKLQGAKLRGAELQGALLKNAKLQGADLVRAKLQDAWLWGAELQGADLEFTKLQGADLEFTKLQGAQIGGAIVNGSTSFFRCGIDANTDFRETGLENTRIESGTKTLLKYNIRRMNWKDWYVEHRLLQWPVKLFWSISNYGISTLRIVIWFFGLAIAFALVYYFVPGLINDLHGTGKWYSDLVRACYFSVVTMTTLGFGDMFANKQSMTGHILLMVQVIWGYVLLGALVTRLAVLFTSDGPAGSFTPMDEETKELLAKLKEDKGI